jgi:hypothetical protein
MNVWIDNTGLQSAGAALLGPPTPDLDQSALYQLATLVAFSDNLLLSNFEKTSVTSRSEEILHELANIGLAPEVIEIVTTNTETFAEACEKAADYCKDKLSEAFSPTSDSLTTEYPAALSKSDVERQIIVSFEVLFSDSRQQLDEIRQRSLDMHAAGAVAYMLSSNEDLRISTRNIVSDHDGSWLVFRQIENFLRYHLNDFLAERAQARYAPSVGRAKLIRRKNLAVAARISELIDVLAIRLAGHPLKVPSVHSYLKEKSNKDPRSVICEAIRIRENTTELRDRLSKRLAGIELSDYSICLDREIEELGKELEAQLGLREEPTFVNAIDIEAVIGLPPLTLSVSGRKLLEWWQYRSACVRNALLTDISRMGSGQH